MGRGVLIYSSAEARTKYGRVVELVDSLDSGSSVHCGRAGSSPASPTKKRQAFCLSFFCVLPCGNDFAKKFRKQNLFAKKLRYSYAGYVIIMAKEGKEVDQDEK